MENIVAIESSGPRLSVALARKKQPGAQIEVLQALLGSDENRHAEELPSLVDSLLQSEGLTPRDVTSVLLGSGPGSFTGLRIGFSFAQGWCWSGTPLRVLSTYTALGYYSLTKFSPFDYALVAGDARRGEVFCAVYRVLNSSLVQEIALAIRRPQEMIGILEEVAVPRDRLAVVVRTTCETTAVLTQSLSPDLSQVFSPTELGEAQALCLYSVVAEASCLTSIPEISGAVPCYMRTVAAQKISERT